ncbi:hypothetical protein BDZ89DRAFT_1127915 [Hymenopellis radicata]|nr:hypothetical protein BDZ89DRAFT_1127915 [Hymenopellis radicata]
MSDHHVREPSPNDEQSPLLPSRGVRVARAILELSPPAQQVSSLSTSNVWDAVDQMQGHASAQYAYSNEVRKLWGEFAAEYCSDKDLDEALFTPVEQAGTGKQTTLVDISALHSPTDRLFHAALTSTWRNGRPRIDGAVPPRVAHLLDLLTYVAGYALVISYVINPPDRAVIYYSEAFRVREFFLILFNIRCRSPSTLTLFAFFLGVGVPRDSTAFGVLLLAFGVYTLQLHLTDFPSPLLVVPESTLPAAWRLRTAFARLKPLTMFIPVLLLAFTLMSWSLRDTFLQFSHFKILSITTPTPLQTRSAFLSIAFISFFAIIVAFFLLAASPAPATPEDEWQKQFYAVTAYYSIPYYFPPPLSILARLPLPYRKWAWRLTVAPFAYALWGLVKFVPWRNVGRVAAVAPVLFVLLALVVQ